MKEGMVDLVLSMVLNFHSSVSKGLKLKVRKFQELIRSFEEVTVVKLVGDELFCHPSHTFWSSFSTKMFLWSQKETSDKITKIDQALIPC